MSDVTVVERRNPLIVLAVVLGAVIVLAALWFLVVAPLLAGDDPDDEMFDPRAGRPDATATEPAAEPTEPTDEDILAALPIETYEIFLSRDPFEPVIPAPAAGDGGGTDGGAPGGGTDTDGDGIPDDVTDSDGDGVPDGDGDDGAVQRNAVLIDVFVDDSGQARALVRVDDRIYTVGEGDAFAAGYAVIAIEGTCVTFTFNGDAFTLCEGGAAPPGDGDDDGGAGDPGPCTGDDEVVCDGHVVTLVDVFLDGDGTPVAVVQVDSTLYEVRRGDTFGQNFQVISIDPPCVTLLYGDDAFTLCEGERTLK